MPAEVVESNGRPERARTADLYRVKKEVFPGASQALAFRWNNFP